MVDDQRASSTQAARDNKTKIASEGDKRFSFKDWVPIGISLLALAGSAATGYYTTFRVEDSLSAVFQTVPVVSWKGENRLLLDRTDEHNVIFINSGTRSVAILSIYFSWVPHSKGTKTACPNFADSDSLTLATDLQPLVIQENGIKTKNVKYADQQPNAKISKSGNEFLLPIDSNLAKGGPIEVTVCATVGISTPSTGSDMSAVQIATYSVGKDGSFTPAEMKDGSLSFEDLKKFFWQRPPQVLLKRTRTIFSD